MRLGTLRVVTVVLCLLGATTLAAQQPSSSSPGPAVPRLVRVTGTFTPADHMPTAPVETVTLAIYADETGGTPLWQETQYVPVDADGHYTVLLGVTLAEGLPADLFASGDARWLGRRFERPGEAEQARVLLASVPYALKAADADTLGGRPASAYLLADPGASASGSAGLASPTTTSGGGVTTSTSSALATSGVTAGTANYVGKFVNATDLGISAMYETGGRVGVNTTNPADFMHVRFTDTSGAVTGYTVQNLGSTGYSGMLFYDQNGALGQFQGFNNSTHEYRINNIASGGTINFMIGSSSKFLVASNGAIGIGKTSPVATLDVKGTLAVTNDQTGPPLQVSNTYSGSSTTDPISAPAAASVLGTTPGTLVGAAGGRAVFATGGTGGLASAASGSNGGAGGIGLHVIAGSGGNSGAHQGGQGGTAIVATGGDAAGGATGSGFGGRGILTTGGAGGPGTQGGVGLFAIGGPGGGGTGGIGAIISAGSDGTTAALFSGDVSISGTLSKSAGSFRIDHPLDPAHKYLSHSFVESPDMKNVYDGIAVLDPTGVAWVELPEWFEALNRDFRYQLTPVGAPAPGLFIASEVQNNRFEIAGGQPSAKVSWMITGIRQDPYANAHRIPVEEAKPENEQNSYLHPELYGQPPERQVLDVRFPDLRGELGGSESK